MPNGTYGGVRGKETKVGQKNFRFPTYSIAGLWLSRFYGCGVADFLFKSSMR